MPGTIYDGLDLVDVIEKVGMARILELMVWVIEERIALDDDPMSRLQDEELRGLLEKAFLFLNLPERETLYTGAEFHTGAETDPFLEEEERPYPGTYPLSWSRLSTDATNYYND